MNRDLDLCRDILQALKEHPEPLHTDKPTIDGRSREEVAYHLELLCEAGLVWSDFKEAQSFVSDNILAEKISQYMHMCQNQDRYRLTWAGHEFLEAARNDTLYNKAKGMLLEKGDGLSFVVLNDLLVSLVKNAVGLK